MAILTPFERGNGDQTTTLEECISFYEDLQNEYPTVLRMMEIGRSDSGRVIRAGVLSSDGVLDRETIKSTMRPIFFNNNGIHPG